MLRFLTGAWFVGLLCASVTPLLFTVGPKAEARFYPVVDHVRIEAETITNEGVTFYAAFDKLRQCDFIGIAWYQGPTRIGVEFEPGANLYPTTRPEGDQYAGPWLVRNVSSLEGTAAKVFHRCHPLWTTVTPFYPEQ